MQEKWALITGATAGIGWATAEALASAQYCIFATGRRDERLQQLKVHLAKLNPKIKVHTASLNVADRKQVDAFFQDEKSLLSKVDVLVNNAGLARGVDKMQNSKVSDWDEMIDTNVKGLLYMTRGVVEHMTAKNSGHIVNMGSVAGRFTYPGGGVYCATKFAVRAISEGLRFDLMGTKIRITNIEPGMVNSEFSKVRLGDQHKADQVYAGMTPLSPKDISETILWCVQRPAHVNIQELVIYPTEQASVGYVSRSN